MKNKRVALKVLLAVLAYPLVQLAAMAQGALTPPGAPAPTMKSLDQIEARSPISNGNYTISQPGSYYLTTNLSVSNTLGIYIATNNVTLDLNGFTVRSFSTVGNNFGVSAGAGLQNITIGNGFVCGSYTNSQDVYSGGGFYYGVYCAGAFNVTVKNVSVSGVGSGGIYLTQGNSTHVSGCNVNVAGFSGITADTVNDSSVNFIDQTDITAYSVNNCFAYSYDGDGISASTVANCVSYAGSQYGISANTVINSYGFSSGSGFGISAGTAENCYGYNTGGGYGVLAYTALNCQGYSSTGYAVCTYGSAENCYGFIGGTNGAGTAVYAVGSAVNCFGSHSGHLAIQASIGIGCQSVGTNIITYKYNMP